MDQGPWIPVETADGSLTLLAEGLGQACHAREGAWTEARERYAIPTLLGERARSGELVGRARLLDVGTGLGWNLAAALQALEGTGVALEAISLEVDPAVIEACLELSRRGPMGSPEADRFHRPIAEALGQALQHPEASAGVPLPNGGHLRLMLGDGRTVLPRLESGFDAVFLDPFSPAVDPPLWEHAFLAGVAVRMAPGSLLSTYTASAQVRTRLLSAGLLVGPGPAVGGKLQGTLASPDRPLPPFPAPLEAKLSRRALRVLEGPPESPGKRGVVRSSGESTDLSGASPPGRH